MLLFVRLYYDRSGWRLYSLLGSGGLCICLGFRGIVWSYSVWQGPNWTRCILSGRSSVGLRAQVPALNFFGRIRAIVPLLAFRRSSNRRRQASFLCLE